MLYQVSGDLKQLYQDPWGPENQGNFPIHLGLECMVFPKAFSQIVLKFDQETDNIMHHSVCYRQTIAPVPRNQSGWQ
jgi:hypothetical protein